MYMRGLCMINVDKQTYLTQTGPRINGQTSGTTSQKRRPSPQEKSNLMGAINTRKPITAEDRGKLLPGTKTIARGTSRITGDQRPLLGISKGSQPLKLGIFQQYAETWIRSVIEELYWGSYQGVVWNSVGNNHQTEAHQINHSLLSTEGNISATEKES